MVERHKYLVCGQLFWQVDARDFGVSYAGACQVSLGIVEPAQSCPWFVAAAEVHAADI